MASGEERVSDVTVSVLVDRPDYLALLDQQDAAGVEVISWADEAWFDHLRAIAERHSWTTTRADDAADALRKATGEFVMGWSVQSADADAITGLATAAKRESGKRGALAANFDPAILWRRDEFEGSTGRTGLAAASIHAMQGSGPEVHPAR